MSLQPGTINYYWVGNVYCEMAQDPLCLSNSSYMHEDRNSMWDELQTILTRTQEFVPISCICNDPPVAVYTTHLSS